MKEYLLLRNNAESGPYSFEELKSMGLKPFDLIWIQNKSFTWKYPSEISELAEFAPAIEIQSMDTEVTDFLKGLEDRLMTGNHKRADNDLKVVEMDSVVVEERNPEKNLSHIVAFQPKVDHTRIKTIKSTSQHTVVKVAVREQEIAREPVYVAESRGGAVLYNPAKPSRQFFSLLQPIYGLQNRKRTRFWDAFRSFRQQNAMEMIVLAIGALSLLAVLYLFFTSGY